MTREDYLFQMIDNCLFGQLKCLMRNVCLYILSDLEIVEDLPGQDREQGRFGGSMEDHRGSNYLH